MRFPSLVSSLVEPMASCVFVSDWQARAARTAAIADYLTVLSRDNPFCEDFDDPHRMPCMSKAPLRRVMHAAFDAAWEMRAVGYDFPHDTLSEEERSLFGSVFSEVDSVEKLAMSACAFAMCNMSPPMQTMLGLCNILYDESLHLEAISVLLGIDQAVEPWIAPKRSKAWSLITSCADLPSYLFVEHCLYEGEGAIAAAMGARTLHTFGEDSTSYRVAHRIFCEETNHALTGYSLLKQHDDSLSPSFFADLARAFVATEGLGEAATFKGRKRRFAVHLAAQYMATRSLVRVHSIIRSNAQAMLTRGHMLVTDEELEKSISEVMP